MEMLTVHQKEVEWKWDGGMREELCLWLDD